ncbi:tRNA adenosine(34) deaminase TadA [Paludicola sp. MB14-C6]|uniref:tRNA adenosine(34) deaminase TadA n=1 Tax=Paludihabitans sp. MB14-C6 TaxID=3070656 RepID=UPI0027DD7F46|nr:tRNA adenosine(34) deaminase TadA [Paludicola sp. MB14-C6]WMJ24058.1 tRNA adenosine(34) deaminase TadA [Paludicola sp. MB14-C6]
MDHHYYMEQAIILAKKARELEEVPIGCIIVKDNKIVGHGYNTRETSQNALGHAELMAIDEACKTLGGWRLFGCTLYVTLEPCPMCMGAIINARIDTVVFGAKDLKSGCCGSVIQLSECGFNHRPKIISNFEAEECGTLISDFFKQLRNQIN